MTLSRRDALSGLLALLAAPALPASARGSVGYAIGDILAILRDRAAARAVGRRYLERYPEDRDQDVLVAMLLDRLQSAAVSAADNGIASVRRALRLAVGRDFEEQAVVDVDGWRLSVTECRLCALTALDWAEQTSPAAAPSA